ncbi:hypothetical protein ACE6H2_007717 [Prunus campanulata]
MESQATQLKLHCLVFPTHRTLSNVGNVVKRGKIGGLAIGIFPQRPKLQVRGREVLKISRPLLIHPKQPLQLVQAPKRKYPSLQDPSIPPKMKLANSTHEAINNTQTTFSLCLAFATDFSSLFRDFKSPGITAFDRSHISRSNHAQNWQPLKPLLFSRTFAAHMENHLLGFEFVQEVRIVAALPQQHIGASSSIPGIQSLLDLLC